MNLQSKLKCIDEYVRALLLSLFLNGSEWTEHSILDCVNSFLDHLVAAQVPMVCVSAVQRKTVM